MHFARELLQGVTHIRLKKFVDQRGSFVKTFASSVFEAHGIDFEWREEFYSLSSRHVIRGMHFQLPPHDHEKLVYCAAGAVLDVLVDLRYGPEFGRVASVELRADEPSLLIIPRGVAHGFKALTDDSLMIYKTSTEHAPTHDAGIRWDSFGFDWGDGVPIISLRDMAHPALADLISPF